MRKKILGWGLLAAFVLTAGAGLVLRQQFYGNAVVTERDLYVSARAEYGQVADSLLPQIKHRRAFDAYARRINLSETFKPGHYVLKHGMSVIEIARMLKLGLQTPVRVTINNVRIPAQLAQKLARQIDADSTAIMQALTSEELAAEVGFDSVTLFSMFIPDSYEFYWTVTPGEFVRRMKREYDRFWTSERDVKRKRSGLSRLEVMTLASIVYEETRKSDEMPRVAGVYVNRLKKGIKLQADPTVKYAMQDFGLPLLYGVVPIITLLCITMLLSMTAMRSPRLRELLCGKPSIVVKDGKLRQREMKKVRITVDELIEELRLKGVPDISSVKYAILETSGEVSVLLRDAEQPATPGQLGLTVEETELPLVVVSDGRVMSENLKSLGYDRTWLARQLREKGYSDPRDVFLLTADSGGVIHFTPKEAGE